MAVIDSLNTAKANYAALLAQISANPRPTYTVGQQTFSWMEFQKFIMEQIKAINEQINVENPFEEEILGMT